MKEKKSWPNPDRNSVISKKRTDCSKFQQKSIDSKWKFCRLNALRKKRNSIKHFRNWKNSQDWSQTYPWQLRTRGLSQGTLVGNWIPRSWKKLNRTHSELRESLKRSIGVASLGSVRISPFYWVSKTSTSRKLACRWITNSEQVRDNLSVQKSISMTILYQLASLNWLNSTEKRQAIFTQDTKLNCLSMTSLAMRTKSWRIHTWERLQESETKTMWKLPNSKKTFSS